MLWTLSRRTHNAIQILELFDYKQFISYVVQMWYKEINNNSELNKKKKVGNCTDYLLIFIDFSCCLYWKIEKFCNFASGNKPRYGWGISLSAKPPPRASPKGKHLPRIPGASLEGWSLWPSLLCFSIPPLRWCSTGLFRECGAWLPQSSWHFQFPGNHNALLSSSRTPSDCRSSLE